jgi:hypothetical protein
MKYMYRSCDLVKKALVLNPATGAPYAPTDLRPGSVIHVDEASWNGTYIFICDKAC